MKLFTVNGVREANKSTLNSPTLVRKTAVNLALGSMVIRGGWACRLYWRPPEVTSIGVGVARGGALAEIGAKVGAIFGARVGKVPG